MAHLGYLLTALADGQLSPATTERVLEHVAACPPCAAELAAERHARLIVAEAECESVGAGLAARLRTICDEPVPGPTDPERSGHPARRAIAWAGLGSVVGASALAACLFVVGSPRDAAPIYSGPTALTSLGAVADAPAGALDVAPAATRVAPTGLPDAVFVVTAERQVAAATSSSSCSADGSTRRASPTSSLSTSSGRHASSCRPSRGTPSGSRATTSSSS